MIRISVVICTRNRADDLSEALDSLAAQDSPGELCEIIVVDNASTDATPEVVSSFVGPTWQTVRYLYEGKVGLSHARNRGWRLARGEYVAYIDDDCKVPREWLEVACDVVERVSPAVFGGGYFAFYNTPKPRWFKDSYGSHDLGSEARALREKEYLTGGNIFFRRRVLERLAGFDPNLGMSGERLAYGEETALQRRIRATMPDQLIYYDPGLYVYHLVRAEKMTMRYIVRQRFIDGRYSYRVFEGSGSHRPANPGRLMARATERVLKVFFGIGRGIVQRDRSEYPYFQNYLYEKVFQHLQAFGSLYEEHLDFRRHRRAERQTKALA